MALLNYIHINAFVTEKIRNTGNACSSTYHKTLEAEGLRPVACSFNQSKRRDPSMFTSLRSFVCSPHDDLSTFKLVRIS